MTSWDKQKSCLYMYVAVLYIIVTKFQISASAPVQKVKDS